MCLELYSSFFLNLPRNPVMDCSPSATPTESRWFWGHHGGPCAPSSELSSAPLQTQRSDPESWNGLGWEDLESPPWMGRDPSHCPRERFLPKIPPRAAPGMAHIRINPFCQNKNLLPFTFYLPFTMGMIAITHPHPQQYLSPCSAPRVGFMRILPL